MMKHVIALVSILILFAGSAAGSWYLYASKKDEGDASESSVSAIPSRAPSSPPPQPDEPENDGQLPVAVRPRPISADDIYRFGNVIRSREEALKKREEQVNARENRVKIMFEDIRAEQMELEAMQAKIESLTDSAESLLTQISAANEEARRINEAAALKESQASSPESDAAQAQNVRRMSEWFQNMEPEKAAEYLRELSNDGNLSMAVQLLANFEERDAAEILAAMDDAALVVQLTEEFKTHKRPEKKKR